MEIVDNKVNGLTFDRENSLDIKEKIIFLYNNKQKIKELSEKAFKKIESKIGFAPMKWATLFSKGNFIGQAELALSNSMAKNRS